MFRNEITKLHKVYSQIWSHSEGCASFMKMNAHNDTL